MDPPTPETSPPTGGFRPEIEGLRGVAVTLVLLYHAGWREASGGYIGVDVFFVLSGFLITGLLLRELTSSHRVSLAGFYARRARRLLPMATLVLLVTSVASLVVLPAVRAEEVGRDATAAALYVSNLRFAAGATDYLALHRAPSPLLHYWSLSVEEQFYLLWPGLLVLAASRLRQGVRRRVGAVIAVVGVASFAACLRLTTTDQPWAFFSLGTRAWELAAGGALALGTGRLPAMPRGLRTALGLTGLLTLLVVANRFDAATPFPGWAALAPVLATLAVIAAGSAPGVTPALGNRATRALGRWSYSTYLWHYPILVITPVAVGHTLSLGANMLLLLVAIALGAASFHLVEDRVRHAPRLTASRRRTASTAATLTALAAGMGLVVTACAPALGQPTGPPAAPPPAASTGPYPVVHVVPRNLTPSLDRARQDVPIVYADGCHLNQAGTVPGPCVFGDAASTKTVILFGDSHAAEWFPAVEQLAIAHHWRLVSMTKSGCPGVLLPVASLTGTGGYPQCNTWHDNAIARIKLEKPALLIMSNQLRSNPAASQQDPWFAGLGSMLDAVGPAATHTLVLGDIPHPAVDVVDCVSGHLNDAAACASPRAVALHPDLNARMATVAGAHHASFAAAEPWLCPSPAACPAVVGNLLLYRDDSHLTTATSRWLTPRLGAVLTPLLG